MALEDEDILKIIEFWRKNPDKIAEIPPEFEGEFTDEEINNFLAEIKEFDTPSLMDYAAKIRQKIKEEKEITGNLLGKLKYSELNMIVENIVSREMKMFRLGTRQPSNFVKNSLKEHHRREIKKICDSYGYLASIAKKYEQLMKEAESLAIKDTSSYRFGDRMEYNKVMLRSLITHTREILKFEFDFRDIDDDRSAKKFNEKYAVFLSHSVKDRILANNFKKLLSDVNVISFVAHDDIDQGEVWEPTIINTVKNSTLMMVIGTKNIEDSAWVNFETGLAYDKMFPILFDKVSYIKNKQGIIIDFGDLDKSLLKVIQTVSQKLGITLKETSTEISSLKSFNELKGLIYKEFKPTKIDSYQDIR